MVKKMKNIEIVNTINGLSEFVGKDKAVPIDLSFAITSNLEELSRAIKPFDKEREKLLQRVEDAKKIKDEESAQEELNKIDAEYKRLMDIEVDVNVATVSKSIVKDIENYCKISTKELMQFRFMIKESEDNEENIAD